jgi:hypothetical protein
VQTVSDSGAKLLCFDVRGDRRSNRTVFDTNMFGQARVRSHNLDVVCVASGSSVAAPAPTTVTTKPPAPPTTTTTAAPTTTTTTVPPTTTTTFPCDGIGTMRNGVCEIDA